ncbi:MAG: zinc-binding alcohol dehydrogenase family protein [Povalibacter sp.]
MNVLVCEAPGRLMLEKRPVPERKEDEVLLRIRRVGICGTDMHIVRGTQPFLTYPRIMGHELAAEVIEAPDNFPLAFGTPTFVLPYLSCGQCSTCTSGRTNCCPRLEVLGVHRDGGLAEYVSVPQRFVFGAEGLTLDQIAMVEFLSIGAHAVSRAKLRDNQRVLVVGAGPIGIATLLFAGLSGAQTCVVDTRTDRLEFCREVLGVHDAVLADANTLTSLSDLTNGAMFDVVFDATGNARAMETGFSYVAHAGTYVFVSIVTDTISFSDPDFHRREMSLLGSRNATAADVNQVMQAIRDGRIPTDALATHRTELGSLARVLPTWMTPEAGVIKGLVEC